VTRDYGIPCHETPEELLSRSDIDAVYIATPHQFHADHVLLAARHGKHVIVEKPIALTLADCDRMLEAADKSGITVLVGHTHSSDPAVQQLRAMTLSGEYGRLAMIALWNYTDFMYRPRRPEELDTARGGGIVYNQLPHQVEVARMIAAQDIRSVRASLFSLDPARPTEGACSGFISFQGGAAATTVYSGYDHFDSDELHSWVSSSGRGKTPAHGTARRALRDLKGSEVGLRTDRYGYGGGLYSAQPTHQPHFGLCVATYERADVRFSPEGLVVYSDQGVHEVALDPRTNGRSALLDEFCAAVLDGTPAIHDGAFARATLRACLGMLESAQTGAEVIL
jgi:phthalate 4,5-cis-dihydrodiol dehydrogenase